jgi:hypothetical protein
LLLWLYNKGFDIIDVIDVQSLETVRRIEVPHKQDYKSEVEYFVFAGNDRVLVVGPSVGEYYARQHTASVYDIQSGAMLRNFTWSADRMSDGFAVSPNGNCVAIAGNGSAKLYDLNSGQSIGSTWVSEDKSSSGIDWALTFSDDGLELADLRIRTSRTETYPKGYRGIRKYEECIECCDARTGKRTERIMLSVGYRQETGGPLPDAKIEGLPRNEHTGPRLIIIPNRGGWLVDGNYLISRAGRIRRLPQQLPTGERLISKFPRKPLDETHVLVAVLDDKGWGLRTIEVP